MIVDDRLLIVTERGELVLANLNTNAYTEVARFLAMPDYNDATNKCWNAPALAEGRLYVRSTANVAAFDLSLPNLRLDSPQPIPPDRLQLTVRTVNGTPVDSNRLPSLEVRAGTDLALSPAQWTKLTNVLTLTNGVVRVTNVDAAPSPRFFIVTEPK
jgi:hypothetical protein